MREIHDREYGTALYAVHFNGTAYAAFSSPDHALAYWRGLDADGRRIFHIEDEKGRRVRLEDNPRSPWHARAILDILDRG